jgi:hypothetical protein
MLVVTGGFVTTISGVRVSARSPAAAAISAAVALAVWFLLAARARSVGRDVADLDTWITSRAHALVSTIAVLAAAATLVFNCFSATGADASGYLSHAAMLLSGSLHYQEPLASIAHWTDGEATLAPLGWRAVGGGLQVPTYAIGLPLLLAPFHLAGGAAVASLVVPVSFLVAILATGALAHRIAGGVAAIVAATWLATSPVALVESMQIMSDVPVTAAWMLCWLLLLEKRAAAAGLVAALALLIRPNLAPVAVIPALFALNAGRRSALMFSVPVAAAATLVGFLQCQWFGSPFRSGYGSATEIYALANVAPNAALYSRWLIETQGPWLFAAPAALSFKASRKVLLWLFAFAAAVNAAYLAYAQFEVWTYLRFLLPALAIGMIATAALVAWMHRRVPAVARPVLLGVVLVGLVATNIAAARSHDVFRFAERNARARTVGERLLTMLPVNSAIVSGEQSGAMRYYTGRTIVRWDLMDDNAMREAVDRLTVNGYQVWVVLDDWEEELFRNRLPTLAAQSLDYEPSVESAAGVGIRTRAWRARRFIARSSNNE